MASPTLGLPLIETSPAHAIDAGSQHKSGRRTRLTAEIQTDIVDRVRNGDCFEAACRQVGIPVGTGREWLARGRGTHAAGRSAAPVYIAFASAIEQAEHGLAAMRLIRSGDLGFFEKNRHNGVQEPQGCGNRDPSGRNAYAGRWEGPSDRLGHRSQARNGNPQDCAARTANLKS
jgi:hypothetical protein